MPIHKAFVFACGHARCRVKPLVIFEQFVRTDLRTAEKMARETGWLKVSGDWYCSPKHAAVAFLEIKRARSVMRPPRVRATTPAAAETLVEVAADSTHVTAETPVAVAADGRDI